MLPAPSNTPKYLRSTPNSRASRCIRVPVWQAGHRPARPAERCPPKERSAHWPSRPPRLSRAARHKATINVFIRMSVIPRWLHNDTSTTGRIAARKVFKCPNSLESRPDSSVNFNLVKNKPVYALQGYARFFHLLYDTQLRQSIYILAKTRAPLTHHHKMTKSLPLYSVSKIALSQS